MLRNVITPIFESAIYRAVKSIFDKVTYGGSAPFDPASYFTGTDDGAFYNFNIANSMMHAPYATGLVTGTGQSIGAAMNLAFASGSRKNLFQNTEHLNSGSPWTLNAITVAVLSGQCPATGRDAFQMTDTATTADHRFGYQPFTMNASTNYTVSCYAKLAAGIRGFRFACANFNNWNANFNLSSGTVSGSSGCTAAIVSVGGGWYRCSAQFTTVGSVQQSYLFLQISAGIYVGDGSSIIVSSPQLELGSLTTLQTIRYPVIQPTAGARPQYNTVASATGGIFDGVDDTLNSVAFSMAGVKRTVCLAVRDLSDGASSPFFNKTYSPYSGASNGAIDVRGDGTTVVTTGGGGDLILSQSGFNAPYKASIISECDTSTPILKLMVNGVETTSSATQSGNTYGSSPICIGSGQGFAPFGNIEVIAALIINRDLTAGEKASWNTFANGLLGL